MLGTIQPEALQIGDTGFKQDVTSSPRVPWQYSGTLGNCYGG